MYRIMAVGLLALTSLNNAGVKDMTVRDGDALAATSRSRSKTGVEFTLPSISGRQLIRDDGGLFFIRGFGYSPTPICQYPGGEPFDTYSGPRLPRRDASWIRYVGGNVVRIYGALFTDGSEEWVIGTTREYLRELEKRGIWVVMGTEIQSVECLNEGCDNVVQAHIDLVRTFRDVPNILMWAPGNEVNSRVLSGQVGAWYDLLDEIARAIKKEQGGVGPSIGPYVSGILGEYNADGTPAVRDLDTRAPNVDVWAINVYRGSSLGTLFQEIEDATIKPFWIAEMGIDSFDHRTMEEDEIAQANYAKALWLQVEKHCDVVCGADIAFYSDEWWKWTYREDCWNPPVIGPCTQDPGACPFGCAPDGMMHEEYLGAMRIAEGGVCGAEVIPKKIYYTIRRLWSESPKDECPQAPFLMDFNAPDCFNTFSNNFAGVVFPVGPVKLNPEERVSGCVGDWALRVSAADVPLPSLFVVTLFPEVPNPKGYSLMSATTVSFHARLGSESAHRLWQVRLEDSYGNKLCNWEVYITGIEFTQFCLDATDCDLSSVAQIAFDPVRTDTERIDVDIVIDNLAIFSEKDDVEDDYVPDLIDNCPEHPNPDQADSDCDGIADACTVTAVFEPPITNDDVALKLGRTLPIKFHLEDLGGNVVGEEHAVRLEVTGPGTGGEPVTYVFDRGDESLRYDGMNNLAHYIGILHIQGCPLAPEEEHTCTAFQDGVPIGSIAFTAFERGPHRP